METRSELLGALDGTVQDLVNTVQKIEAERVMVYELWTAADVLRHITFWHESFARNTADLAEGRKPSPLKGRLMDLNQRSVEELNGVPLDQVVQRLQKAHEQIQAHILNPALELIPYRKGSRDYSPAEHLEIVRMHIREHLKDINKVYMNDTNQKKA